MALHVMMSLDMPVHWLKLPSSCCAPMHNMQMCLKWWLPPAGVAWVAGQHDARMTSLHATCRHAFSSLLSEPMDAASTCAVLSACVLQS